MNEGEGEKIVEYDGYGYKSCEVRLDFYMIRRTWCSQVLFVPSRLSPGSHLEIPKRRKKPKGKSATRENTEDVLEKKRRIEV